jgi:general stress protein 26
VEVDTMPMIATLLLASMPLAPVEDEAPSQRERLLETARAIVEAARYCTMVTLDAEGSPQARIIDAFAPEDDFSVWIGTKRTTRKVTEIGADPRVTLLYFDREDPGFVTLVGRAELVDDPKQKAARFKEEWRSFYEDGPLGPDYVLIRVRAERLEIVSESRGAINDPDSWLPPIVRFAPGH